MTFQIITPGKYVEAHEVQVGAGIQGEIVLSAKKNGCVVRERKFKNLITNYGLNRFGTVTVGDVYQRCQVGTGTKIPEVTDIALSNWVASSPWQSGGTASNSGAPDYISTTKIVFTFPLGAVSGNLTEIGIGGTYSVAQGQLFSRALILDSGGAPVAFPIASDEQLEVTYLLSLVPPLTDQTGTVKIGATTYDYIARPLDSLRWGAAVSSNNVQNMHAINQSNHGVYASALVAHTDTTLGSYVANSTGYSNGTYVANSYELTRSATWGPGSFNRNFRSASFRQTCCTFQIEYNPLPVKTNLQTMVLPFKLGWGRAA